MSSLPGSTWTISHLAKVVAAAVGAELGDLVGEGGELAGVAQEVEAAVQRIVCPVVAGVCRVFAAVPPVARDPEHFADLLARALGREDPADLLVDPARLGHTALALACARRRAPA